MKTLIERISTSGLLSVVASACFLGGLGGAAAAAVLRVPSQYATIQAAIAAASEGDVVVVAPGTYNEAIDFVGKAITVASAKGPSMTTLTGPTSSSLVTFRNGEGAASVLDGFTLREGTGTSFGHIPYGGGVVCEGTSPTLIGNRFVENRTAGAGGAIHCRSGAAPHIERCDFIANEATLRGGAIDLGGADAVIVDCTFRDNSPNAIHTRRGSVAVRNSTFRQHAGNALQIQGFTSRIEVLVDGCRFLDNRAAVSAVMSAAGSRLTVSGCRIESNRGGAIYAIVDEARLERNLIFRNETTLANAAVSLEGQTELVGNIIAWNSSAKSALDLRSGTLTSRHDTILENDAPTQVSASGSMSLNSSIVWASTGFVWDGTAPTFDYCFVHHAVALGRNNLVGDPLLVDVGGDAHLRIESPCVDAADPDASGLPAHDADGDDRIAAGLPGGDAIPDIGADEMRPELAARYGTVDASTPTSIADVVFINGMSGQRSTREIHIAPGEPLEVDIIAPPAGPEPAPFALYAWRAEPSISTISEQPYHLGWTALPTPIQNAKPDETWNNIGSRPLFGRPTRSSRPAPERVARVPRGFPVGTVVTIQGFVSDQDSTADLGLSTTNAIVLRVDE